MIILLSSKEKINEVDYKVVNQELAQKGDKVYKLNIDDLELNLLVETYILPEDRQPAWEDIKAKAEKLVYGEEEK